MKKLIFCFIVCLWTITAWAQHGSYFLTHHAPSGENFDNVCFDMVQDNHGIMYFAMKAGVLEFDGREWDLIAGAGAVYGLDRNEAGEIFWVGAKGFGKIGLDEKGFKRIQYLSDSSIHNVFQALAVGDQVYFLSENKIFLYHPGANRADMIISGNGMNMFTGMFELFGTLYVQTERNTTFRVENQRLMYVNLNFSGNVLFQSRMGDTYLLGTSDNRVYTCEKNLVANQLKIKDQPYADANVIINGTWVDKHLLALGTLRGGVMLVNPLTGERDQIIDYSTGLPDNEVFSLMADASQNIWVAHEYGFTQISPSLPFRTFSYYDGLEGNMLCVYSYRNSVYVGTSLGLFKLDKEEVFDTVVTYVEVEITSQDASNPGGEVNPPSDRKQPGYQEETPSRRRGFFNFLRRNREKDEDDVQAEKSQSENSNEAEDEKKNVRIERRIDKVLRSSQYVFKKVEGIEAKISHLVEVDGKLVAAGLEGVFQIHNLSAKAIINSPARCIYASDPQEAVIVSTYNDQIWLLHYKSGWQQVNLINNLGDQIDYIFEGAENEWWLCGLDRIYQLQLNKEGIQRLQTIDLSNPNFEKTVGIYADDQIMFVNNDGFFRFEREKNKLNRIDSLPRPYQYFASDGHILYRGQHRWGMLGEAEGTSNLQLLNLFSNLRFITTDQDPENLWMISGSNELLKFEGEKVTPVHSRFPIFLKSIENNSEKIADFSRIQIDQRKSAITFEVVQPDFINPKSIEFRFFLDGMHQEWSDWSSANNKINFPYLPPGEYKLRVEARNIFGRISQLSPVSFQVFPPYWKEPWFYALEFIIFASLVIVSFRLSARYSIISRLLSLITIILLIEFIQTVIGSSIIAGDTPVEEFFVQVVVALLVLPVEGFLRNLMLRSLDSNSKLYKLIATGKRRKAGGRKPSKKRKLKETL